MTLANIKETIARVFSVPPGGFIIAEALTTLFATVGGHDHDGINSALVPGSVRTAILNLTEANINAGGIAIATPPGLQLTVVGFKAYPVGIFATGAGIVLADTEATPVPVGTILTAALNDGAATPVAKNASDTSANVNIGVGFGIELPVGVSLTYGVSGSPFTSGTSCRVVVFYTLQ